MQIAWRWIQNVHNSIRQFSIISKMPCGSQLLALHTRFSSKLLNEGICFANHALIIFWRKTGMDELLSS